ncbi:MAG: WecB/TagA/CpsF family glycosyltransferase [Pseudomonadota bacterium]
MVKCSQFMGYRINALPLSQLKAFCAQRIQFPSQDNIVFSCANPHALAVAETNANFRKALENSDLLVTDGVGVSIIGNLLGVNIGPRITGSDFFTALMEHQNTLITERITRVYFFGSSQKVLNLMKINLERLYPNLEICGYTSPPYGTWSESENSQFVARINAAKPDILWVGMTAPKQELWTFNNRHKLAVSVIGNVGAVFDFCAGTYERAPEWARKNGLEWLVRLWKEPKRMWKRNFISPIIFILAAVRFRFKKTIES